jgi:hypothetical protein
MVRLGDQFVSMTWHHIIPYALLRDVWNNLVDQHIATQLPEARVAIRQYLSLVDARASNLDDLVDRMRAENTTKARAGHNPLQPLDLAEANRLAAAAVWPAWDVVQGPISRTDDMRDRSLDRFSAGLTPGECGQMKAIERLFIAFTAFANAGQAPGKNSLNALTQMMRAERSALSRDLPIRFRAEMWVKDGSAWRKRRDLCDEH